MHVYAKRKLVSPLRPLPASWHTAKLARAAVHYGRSNVPLPPQTYDVLTPVFSSQLPVSCSGYARDPPCLRLQDQAVVAGAVKLEAQRPHTHTAAGSSSASACCIGVQEAGSVHAQHRFGFVGQAQRCQLLLEFFHVPGVQRTAAKVSGAVPTAWICWGWGCSMYVGVLKRIKMVARLTNKNCNQSCHVSYWAAGLHDLPSTTPLQSLPIGGPGACSVLCATCDVLMPCADFCHAPVTRRYDPTRQHTVTCMPSRTKPATACERTAYLLFPRHHDGDRRLLPGVLQEQDHDRLACQRHPVLRTAQPPHQVDLQQLLITTTAAAAAGL